MKNIIIGQGKQNSSPMHSIPNTKRDSRLGMSPYETVLNQKPRKPTKIKLGTTTDEMGNCKPTETSACNTQLTHT